MKKYFKCFVVLLVGFILGAVAYKNKEMLIDGQFIRDHFHFRTALKNKKEILNADQTMVMLAFGQSNAANYGQGKYHCHNEVYNYYKGDLYKGVEPLLGADGKGISVWSRVADLVIDHGLYKKVIIVPFGMGATSIESWLNGSSRKRLDQILVYLKKDGIKPTHILWLQGETDNFINTPKAQYKTRLISLINVFRDQHINAPFFTSVTSYFPFAASSAMGINEEIRSAQKEVISEVKNVFQGPDTDSLNLAYYRADGVHFTEKGLDRLALEWLVKIKAAQ